MSRRGAFAIVVAALAAVVGVIALAVAVTPPAGSGGQAASETPASGSLAGVSADRTPQEDSQGRSDGPSESIKVHGEWTIEVRNPDGALVSHTEFNNALPSAGGSFLARALGRNTAPGRLERLPWGNRRV